jgi:hypothetical protein
MHPPIQQSIYTTYLISILPFSHPSTTVPSILPPICFRNLGKYRVVNIVNSRDVGKYSVVNIVNIGKVVKNNVVNIVNIGKVVKNNVVNIVNIGKVVKTTLST